MTTKTIRRSHLFISFEGPDGSGKTTQARLLADYLRAAGREVVFTREPGGTAIGDQIRRVLHDPANTAMEHSSETLLYSAARAQLVAERIRPGLARGAIVVCDRYADSTLAYQGYGRGLDLTMLRAITAFATGGLVPDLTIWLDLDAAEGLRRRQGSGGEWNRMDQLPLELHERVRAGYRELAAADPGRWVRVDGTAPVQEVHERVVAVVEERLRAQTKPQMNTDEHG
jgi:dTMP kinase